MASISKNVYIDKLDEIVNQCNNTYHSTIKVKPADGKNNTYTDSGKKSYDKDPKFKFADYVRLSKYKNTIAKEYTPNRSEEVFAGKKSQKHCSMDIHY